MIMALMTMAAVESAATGAMADGGSRLAADKEAAQTGGRCTDPGLRSGDVRPFSGLDLQQIGPLPAPARSPGVVGIERDRERIRLPLGTAIDLGGVGKGRAADVVATGLIRRGAVSACVSLGGDIRVAGGVPEDGGWSIPVDDPHDCSRHLGRVLTADASIVTSTTEFRAWTRDGRTMHHLIDPRTGMPADTGVHAVVVTAPQAWLAEGFAKAAPIAGRVAGRRMLDAAGIGGWIIGNDRSCTATEWAPAMTKPASARPTVTLTYEQPVGSELEAQRIGHRSAGRAEPVA